jgi:hypothetical protein
VTATTGGGTVSIVVRTVGERTTPLCVHRLRRALPASPLVVVQASPFRQALRSTFTRGLELGARWTLVIDADVIVRPKLAEDLLAVAEHADQATFVVQGIVRDKFFGIMRPAGNHLYRTKYLAQALDCLPDAPASLRPESVTIDRMVLAGYGFRQCDVVVGLHDFEQSFGDVARKCFLQAFKHRSFLAHAWPRWRHSAEDDDDFRVAMAAVEEGLAYSDPVYVDRQFLDSRVAHCLRALALMEKQPLEPDRFSDEHVTTALNREQSDPRVEALQRIMFPKQLWNRDDRGEGRV